MNSQEKAQEQIPSFRNTESHFQIRSATEQDAQAIRKIYAPYVKNTAITFEYEVPSVLEFTNRIRHTLLTYPYLVAESANQIIGYAYAGPFKGRAAYNWDVETTVYISKEWKRQRIGTALYTQLEKILVTQNITNLYACVAFPEMADAYLNMDSIYFHEHLGFQIVGQFKQCGYKFNRWYHVAWMEKIIGQHQKMQPSFLPYPAVKK